MQPATRITEPTLGGTSKRSSDLWVALLGAGLLVWTLATLAFPVLRSTARVPEARVMLETAAVVVSGVIAAVAYLRWSLTGSRRSLFVALAFFALAVSRSLFAVVLEPAEGFETYTWSVGRLVAATLLVVGAFQPSTTGPPRRPAILFAWGAAAIVAALTVLNSLISTLRAELPPTTLAPAGGPAWSLPNVDPVHAVFGFTGAGLFLVAYAVYRRRPSPATSGWFLAALILGAASHVHYVINPTALSDRLSTGDGLRLAFSGALLFAVLSEVRRGYIGERQRALELAGEAREHRRRVEELEHLDRSRVELTRMVSHELMHPVAAIRTLTSVLTSRTTELSEVDRRRFLDALERESIQLREVAEAAPSLATTQEEPFPVEVAPIRVGDMVEEVTRSLEHLGERVRFVPDPSIVDVVACVDVTRVTQVLHNLVSNAERHGDAEGPVEVGVQASERELQMAVTDHGSGFPRDRLANLFERPQARSRGEGRQGLGLYICRRIVEAHGGRIWLDGDGTGGTTIAFTVPLNVGAAR